MLEGKLLEKSLEQCKIGRNLFNRRFSREITRNEFDSEIAYWMLGYLDDMRYRLFPTVPNEVEVYFTKKKDNPDYTLSNTFWNEPKILAWRIQKSKIWHENNANMYWLKFMKNTLPQEDTANHNRVDVMIRTHPKEQTKEEAQ